MEKRNSSFAFLEGLNNAASYIHTLENHLLSFEQEKYTSLWIFQRDNASIDKATLNMKWFNEKSVKVMDWTARSADLNAIEKI